MSEVDAWKFLIISGGSLQNNIPDQFAVQTPLMLKTDDGLYINIYEAALINYPSMQLHVNRSTYSLSRNLIPLGFLEKGRNYVATIYADAANADWESSPKAYRIEKFVVNGSVTLKLPLAKGRGSAVSLMPATAVNSKGIKLYQ